MGWIERVSLFLLISIGVALLLYSIACPFEDRMVQSAVVAFGAGMVIFPSITAGICYLKPKQ
jgi:hypothetical protein